MPLISAPYSNEAEVCGSKISFVNAKRRFVKGLYNFSGLVDDYSFEAEVFYKGDGCYRDGVITMDLVYEGSVFVNGVSYDIVQSDVELVATQNE